MFLICEEWTKKYFREFSYGLERVRQITPWGVYRRSQARYSVASLLTSATCCGMESAQRAEWNHGNAVYGINPKERYTLARDAMPSQSDGLHATRVAR